LEESLPPTSLYNILNLMLGFDYKELEEDVSRLKAIPISILNDMGGGGATFFVNLINEVYHFGACENHIIASIVGGIDSQEAIKVNFKYNFELFQC
jgi:hypothetical protein